MLITLYKIGELHFPCLGTNGFHVKAKSDRFTNLVPRVLSLLRASVVLMQNARF